MRIFLIENKEFDLDRLMEKLLRTDDINEVISVMRGIRNRTIFVSVINRLLNMLSETTEENQYLINKLKEQKEVEIL
jgi:hypothetical protein